jgi:hypothetical protein
MSTPNYEYTPPQKRRTVRAAPMSDQDMLAYMQQMIDMQYEQQRYASASASHDTTANTNTNTNNGAPPDYSAQIPRRISPAKTSTAVAQAPVQPAPLATASSSASTLPPSTTGTLSSVTSAPEPPSFSVDATVPPNDDDDNVVGQGTILFPTGRESLKVRTDSVQSSDTAPLPPSMVPANSATHTLAAAVPIVSYGALNDIDYFYTNNNNNNTANANTAALSSHPSSNASQQQSMRTDGSHVPSEINSHHAQLEEGLSDTRDISSFSNTTVKQASHHDNDNCCFHMAPLFDTAWHRSFCYGAMDGLLTGSGLLATLGGMGVLQALDATSAAHAATPWRVWVLVLTMATCGADAVCMAMGHAWTSRNVAAAHARERQEAKTHLMQARADAKGHLVDVLLNKGLLKIDAISMADILEGYPDLFVSVLTGDAWAAVEPDTTGNLLHNRSALERRLEAMNDPEAYAIHQADREARKESLGMMFGFALLALVPSLVYGCLPDPPVSAADSNHALYLQTSDAHGRFLSSLYPADTSSSTADASSTMLVNPNTLVVLVTTMVMGCLGIWKSTFVDGNWLMFAIEAIVVLWVCMALAYALGLGLNAWWLPDYVMQWTTMEQ